MSLRMLSLMGGSLLAAVLASGVAVAQEREDSPAREEEREAPASRSEEATEESTQERRQETERGERREGEQPGERRIQESPRGERPAQPPREGERPQGPAIEGGASRTSLGVLLAPSPTRGVRISSLEQNGAASRGGLRAGDYIMTIDGKTISSPQEVQEAIAGFQPGDKAEIGIWRSGEEQTMTVEFFQQRQAGFRGAEGERGEPGAPGLEGEREGQPRGDTRSTPRTWLGVALASQEERPEDAAEGGFVQNVFPSSPAARAGFRTGDVIVSVGEKEASTAREVIDAIDQLEPGKETEFTIMREGEKQTITATLADRTQFFGNQSQGRGGREFRDGSFDPNDVPEHAMMLEQNRRIAEQHQRLEERLDQVIQELQALRAQMGRGGEGAAPGARTPGAARPGAPPRLPNAPRDTEAPRPDAPSPDTQNEDAPRNRERENE